MVDRTVTRVGQAAARATDADDLLSRVSDEVRRVVDYDAAMWFGVDPGTLLATAPSRVEGDLLDSFCGPYWHGEFHDQDALLFRDLARAPVPAGALHGLTDGSPMRSGRYRAFNRPQGLDDELRVVFRTGGSTWGVADFFRAEGRPPFTSDDVALLSGLSATVGAALRMQAASSTTPWPVSAAAPGLLVFDRDDVLLSANAEAADWLNRAYGTAPGDSWVDVMRGEPAGSGLRLPFPAYPLLTRARAVAAGRDPGPARFRQRDARGRWLVLHASVLAGAGDEAVAVVVEPATSADVAPIIIEAYGLTPRERDVVRAIARGLSTPEIAAELYLSAHTVRDYLKTIFDKVGVGSRGELVARLFAEHYADPMHAALVHAH